MNCWLLLRDNKTAAHIFALALLLAQLQTHAQVQRAPTAPAGTRVSTAAELVAAVKAGGAIDVSPGTYVVNLVLAKPLTLRGPSDAVLAPADPLEPTVLVTGNDIAVTGLTIQAGAPDRETLVVGDFTATSADVLPHRVRFEGVKVVARAGGHRGMALHGVDITVTGSAVTGYWEKGRDSQAIWLNGPGPYTITNNVLEASGENLLVGGADPGIVGMNPSDITIRGNTLGKPANFQALGTVKNSFELKTGVHVLFEDNIVDGWWPGVHQAPIQITPRNQDGHCPWCTVNDVIISRTTFRNVTGGFAVNVQGTDDEHPSGQIEVLKLDHNLFLGSTAGFQILGGVSKSLIIDHNTAPSITARVFSFDRIAGQPNMLTPLTFTQNVVRSGAYGATGDGSTGAGLPSLLAFTTLTDWSGNLIEATAPVKWPAGQATIPAGALATRLDEKFKVKSGTAGY
jgi:hypothetical protein